MKTITFLQKINTSGQPIEIGEQFIMDAEKAQKDAQGTNSIYVRRGYLNNTPFLSQRGHGSSGDGDVCKLNEDENLVVAVSNSLYSSILIFAEKNKLVVKK